MSRIVTAIVLCCIGLTANALGQEEGTKRSGREGDKTCALLVSVVDSDGSKIRDASVFVRQGGARKSVRPTLAGGMYLFPRLSPGELSVGVTKQGFEIEKEDYTLDCSEFAGLFEIELTKKNKGRSISTRSPAPSYRSQTR